MLGQIPEFTSVGELFLLWQRGLMENHPCGCGRPFRSCPFWERVGVEAFRGWHAVDAHELIALQRRVDRNRLIPLMARPNLVPGYRRDFDRYADYLVRLYRGVQRASGAPVVVDSTKHPSTAFLLSRLGSIDLCVVHLVRDSHGVAFSWTKLVPKPEATAQVSYMSRYHPVVTGLRWTVYNAFFQALRQTEVPTFLLRYEDLVRQPRESIHRIVAFAGGERDETSVGFIGKDYVDLDHGHSVTGNPMRLKRGRIPLQRDEDWRHQMTRLDRAVVSATTWPHLLRYGYWGPAPAKELAEPATRETR
jgi:hypothetical protein